MKRDRSLEGMVIVDGSYGEGGGQILRTSLALSLITGKPLRVVKIRAGRKEPGLMAQHLTGVSAAAQVCAAHLEGAELSSQTLTFIPGSPPKPGSYSWDVAAARKGGSAGAASLVLQTLLLPLALGGGAKVAIRGGTHVPWSPPYHYLEVVYLPTLARMGLEAKVAFERWGWYPMGGGVLEAHISGVRTSEPLHPLRPLDLHKRGRLLRLCGVSLLSNLPSHITQRQRRRALEILRGEGFDPQIDIQEGESPGRGTALFLWAEFENGGAGFTFLGAPGKPAERVAEEACEEFLKYYRSEAALDKHLADQLILPMALADGLSSFTTCEITPHLLTNIWVVKQFLDTHVEVEGEEGKGGRVTLGRSGLV